MSADFTLSLLSLAPRILVMVITVHLVEPNTLLLPGYERALAAGWSPETSPEPQHGIREQHLREIRADPQGFLKWLTGINRVVERLLDGTPVPPMREVVYWISDGEFSGVISLRRLRNSGELPAGISGHVSYAVVPWKSRKGYARQALADLLLKAPSFGLNRLLVTTHQDNLPSRRVIEATGGIFAGLVPHPNQPGRFRLQFWLFTPAQRAGWRNNS
jgi:predicted acetyltransferase